jgi:hypothetical protein
VWEIGADAEPPEQKGDYKNEKLNKNRKDVEFLMKESDRGWMIYYNPEPIAEEEALPLSERRNAFFSQ